MIFPAAVSLTLAVSCCCSHLKSRRAQSSVSCQLGYCFLCQLFGSLSQNRYKNKTHLVFHIQDLGWDQLFMSFPQLS
jgi:hypothetical protein